MWLSDKGNPPRCSFAVQSVVDMLVRFLSMAPLQPHPSSPHEALKHFKEHCAAVKLLVHLSIEFRLTVTGVAPCLALLLLALMFDVKTAIAALWLLGRGG